MANGGNRKRKPKRAPEGRSLWGSLFQGEAGGQTAAVDEGGFFHQPTEPEENRPRRMHYGTFLLRQWAHFSVWTLVATGIFLAFTVALFIITLRMWVPQDLRDIAGYDDAGTPRDLLSVLQNANGAPITITEAELNRYLRDNYRMSQTGIFSILTHGQGLAVRIHNGYAEVIFDRIIGSNMHQTTAANLTFSQTNELGQPKLHVDFRGGAPMFGTIPVGGRIGCMPMPRRYISMLKPPLESLLTCNPEIARLIEQYHYCPIFTEGQERRVTLIPYSPSH